MKRVLIITYYWPPSGGSGVQRWLYFSKYLRKYGWEPVIFTVSNGEYPYLDEGLQKHVPENLEVIRRPVWEPYSWYKLLSGHKGKVDPTIMAENKKGSLMKKLLLWVRGNVFIPDARMFWIVPSIKYLSAYLQAHPVDLIVSTGPPHSAQLIARKLKRRLRIPWLADFRDPWTQIYFFDQLKLSGPAKWMHKRLEASVLREADRVVTVSRECQTGLEQCSGRPVEVITNGYEPFELPEIRKQDDKWIMLYSGVLSLDRNPSVFWKSLETFLERHPVYKDRFELQLIGNIDKAIVDQLRVGGLKDHFQFMPSMPHAKLQHYLARADLLLMIGVPHHKGVITGKFFEYLFLRKPIVSISPDGSDVEPILEETGSGDHADFEDADRQGLILENAFLQLQHGNLRSKADKIGPYSRESLTGQMAALFDALMKP
ncbi:MAG TPA: glycosyltransferase [Saprospiraceae bacterium]|nr:glycosyltransferase [Saprospiraceae bacterium]